MIKKFISIYILIFIIFSCKSNLTDKNNNIKNNDENQPTSILQNINYLKDSFIDEFSFIINSYKKIAVSNTTKGYIEILLLKSSNNNNFNTKTEDLSSKTSVTIETNQILEFTIKLFNNSNNNWKNVKLFIIEPEEDDKKYGANLDLLDKAPLPDEPNKQKNYPFFNCGDIKSKDTSKSIKISFIVNNLKDLVWLLNLKFKVFGDIIIDSTPSTTIPTNELLKPGTVKNVEKSLTPTFLKCIDIENIQDKLKIDVTALMARYKNSNQYGLILTYLFYDENNKIVHWKSGGQGKILQIQNYILFSNASNADFINTLHFSSPLFNTVGRGENNVYKVYTAIMDICWQTIQPYVLIKDLEIKDSNYLFLLVKVDAYTTKEKTYFIKKVFQLSDIIIDYVMLTPDTIFVPTGMKLLPSPSILPSLPFGMPYPSPVLTPPNLSVTSLPTITPTPPK